MPQSTPGLGHASTESKARVEDWSLPPKTKTRHPASRSDNLPSSIDGRSLGGGLLPDTEIFMEAKSKTISEHRTHDKDTGSPEVQVALLTSRINNLTEHLQKNQRDHGSRRGLLILVSQRRRLLNYLQKKDERRYQTLTKKLKLRK